jgi:hypothetical protein
MNVSSEVQQEPINERLERLATAAEFEEKAAEQEKLPGEEIAAEQQLEEDAHRKEAARTMAKGIVEGVEKLAPCLESEGVAPPWVVNLLGRYGKFIEAGLWFGAVGFSTYRTVQDRKAEQEKASQQQPAKVVAVEPMASGAPFTTAGQ